MKKIFTILTGLVLSTGLANAQSNLNLDAWADDITPTGWRASLNNYIGTFVEDTSVTKTSDAVANNAAKLKPVNFFGYYFSTLAYGPLGKGDAYATRANYVSLWYKTTGSPTQGTTAGVATAYLTKFNGTIPDTLATAELVLDTATNGSYKFAEAAFVYDPNFPNTNTPDSLRISISVLSDSTDQASGYTLLVDEVKLTVSPGAGVKNNTSTSVLVYPTIASSTVNFAFGNNITAAKVNVTDLSGKLVKSVSVNGNYTMNVSDLQNGAYIYNVVDKSNNAVKAGKFVVLH